MKVFQKALLVSVLSLGVSYPLLAADTNPVSQALMVSMSADIKSLQEKNQRLEHENFKLQTQILDLTRTAPKQASAPTNIREDVRNLQVTMKEMVAEQKKFHRDYLRLSLRRPDGMGEEKVIKLLEESLAELENSPPKEKNQ